MGHTLEISQEAYDRLREVAARRGQTPEALVEEWTARLAEQDTERNPYTDPRHESFDEFFRGLGMAETDIEMAKQAAEDDGERDADI